MASVVNVGFKPFLGQPVMIQSVNQILNQSPKAPVRFGETLSGELSANQPLNSQTQNMPMQLPNESLVANFMTQFPEFAPPPFNAAFHKERRNTFISKLPEKTTVILVGGQEIRRNNDVNYPFRQQNDFYYLTGFDEPGSYAILSNVPGQPQFSMFVPPKDPAKEVWTGRRTGPEGAKSKYLANAAFDNNALPAQLGSLLAGAKNVMISGDEHPEIAQDALAVNGPEQAKVRQVIQAVMPDVTVGSATDAIREMRVIKTPYEIALLKRACAISALSHLKTMKQMKLTRETLERSKKHKEGRNEGEIQAKVEYYFRRHGGERVGYPSISGAAANGCVLHYVSNKEFAKPEDLVLLDAGSEYGYYTADITRTWPVSGKFSPAQKAIYNIVLAAQEAGIQAVKPGATLASIHSVCVKKVTEGLVGLGLLSGTVEENIASKAYTQYFMHGTSHFLGMDVHDTSGSNLNREQGKNRPLEPGMALTVEPGIYIDPAVAEKNGLPKAWWGIGVRIEDDILVTPTGCENMSAGVPKTVAAIEALMASKTKK
jgi:Xaa-Pro aminopeptidase